MSGCTLYRFSVIEGGMNKIIHMNVLFIVCWLFVWLPQDAVIFYLE